VSTRASFRLYDSVVGGTQDFEYYVGSDSFRTLLRQRHGDLIQVPVGSCVLLTGSSVPEGWLKCDGALYPIAKYSKLYDVVRNTYGGAATSGTFAVPNLTAVSGINYYIRY